VALQVEQAGHLRRNQSLPVAPAQSLPASFKQRLQVAVVVMFHPEWVALQVRDKAQVALQAKVQAAPVAMFLQVWPVVAPVEVALQALE
jgi:hypothetical protein